MQPSRRCFRSGERRFDGTFYLPGYRCARAAGCWSAHRRRPMRARRRSGRLGGVRLRRARTDLAQTQHAGWIFNVVSDRPQLRRRRQNRYGDVSAGQRRAPAALVSIRRGGPPERDAGRRAGHRLRSRRAATRRALRQRRDHVANLRPGHARADATRPRESKRRFSQHLFHLGRRRKPDGDREPRSGADRNLRLRRSASLGVGDAGIGHAAHVRLRRRREHHAEV